MSIPIRNLYLLLSYAWDALEASDIRVVGSATEGPPQDLLASMLADTLAVALRRGLYRDYQTDVEETELPRGRLLFTPTLSRTCLARGRVVAERSDLSVDISLNRIAKAAVIRLLHTREVNNSLRDRLAGFLPLMRGVTDTPLSTTAILRTPVHSTAAAYRMVLGVAALVAESTTPQENGRNFQFADFIRDEHKMRRLFQRFVRVFLTREQSVAQVVARSFHWLGLEAEKLNGIMLPRMETDVVLITPQRLTVIDTKFTPKHFATRYGSSSTLRSDHLYQMFAYVQNIPRDENQSVNGVLLYPSTNNGNFDVSWRLPSGAMRAKTVNLSASWEEIRASLLQLAAA